MLGWKRRAIISLFRSFICPLRVPRRPAEGLRADGGDRQGGTSMARLCAYLRPRCQAKVFSVLESSKYKTQPQAWASMLAEPAGPGSRKLSSVRRSLDMPLKRLRGCGEGHHDASEQMLQHRTRDTCNDHGIRSKNARPANCQRETVAAPAAAPLRQA